MQKEWKQVTAVPPLGEGEIQVWRLDLATAEADRVVAAASRMLLPSELQRAERIRMAPARREFIAGRGLLRSLIGDDARTTVFGEGANGKPILAGAPGLEVNVSHSGGMILVAVSKAGPVGVDVEFVDSAFAASQELLEIARNSFDAAQFHLVERAGSHRERLLEFYRAWTRKEAVAKADGRGIAEPLDCVFEEADPPTGSGAGDEYRVSLAGNGDQVRSEFVVRGLAVGPHHAGALAAHPTPIAVHLLDAAGLFASDAPSRSGL